MQASQELLCMGWQQDGKTGVRQRANRKSESINCIYTKRYLGIKSLDQGIFRFQSDTLGFQSLSVTLYEL